MCVRVEALEPTPWTGTPMAALADEDAPLVARARGGDLPAFEELYRRTAARVFALCMRMTGDLQRAEELTQDVFVRAWQKLATFRGESRFSSWLFRLAVNVVLSAQRARRLELSRFVPADDSPVLDGTAVRSASHHPVDLERAIATLPEGARRVFVLHDVEGYRHEEIAELVGIAVGTSKAQLHRARRLLREVLGR
jgi:RNA polymerase sigma-70 factor, ECF subfamily